MGSEEGSDAITERAAPDVVERLCRYREKRDFDRTDEPAPGSTDPGGDVSKRFVVHEHHARRLHWDLRLEHEGTLLSWAVPKGLPDRPDRNRLAVRTEDHPLEYLEFEGDIPAGEYGAGRIRVWDHGTFELHELLPDKVVFTLQGQEGRALGRHALIRTGDRNWLLHRMDPPIDAAAEALPEEFVPTWPATGELPFDGDWGCSPDLGGLRTLAFVEGGRARLMAFGDAGSEGVDVTSLFPEVQGVGRVLGSRPAILDGVLVAFAEDARPDSERLLQRLGAGSESQVRRLRAQVPVVLVLSDLAWIDGRSRVGEPYATRRRRLESLGIDGANWQVAPLLVADCAGLLREVVEQGLTGIDARRLDAPYEPGSSPASRSGSTSVSAPGATSGPKVDAWRRVKGNTHDPQGVAPA